MKVSTLRADVHVPKRVKLFALILSILDNVYGSERESLIKSVAHYCGVTL